MVHSISSGQLSSVHRKTDKTGIFNFRPADYLTTISEDASSITALHLSEVHVMTFLIGHAAVLLTQHIATTECH